MSSATLMHGDTLKTVPRARYRVPRLTIEQEFVVFNAELTKHALTINKLEPVLSTS